MVQFWWISIAQNVARYISSLSGMWLCNGGSTLCKATTNKPFSVKLHLSVMAILDQRHASPFITSRVVCVRLIMVKSEYIWMILEAGDEATTKHSILLRFALVTFVRKSLFWTMHWIHGQVTGQPRMTGHRLFHLSRIRSFQRANIMVHCMVFLWVAIPLILFWARRE